MEFLIAYVIAAAVLSAIMDCAAGQWVRSSLNWFLISMVASPLLTGILLLAVGPVRVGSLQRGRPVLQCADGQTPPVSAAGLVVQGVVVQVARGRVR